MGDDYVSWCGYIEIYHRSYGSLIISNIIFVEMDGLLVCYQVIVKVRVI